MAGIHWTEEEIKFLTENFHKKNWPEILKNLPNKSKPSIRGKAFRLNLSRGRFDKWTKEEDDFISAKFGQTSIAAIARKLNRTKDATMHRKNKLGLHNINYYLSVSEISYIMGFNSSQVAYKWIRDGKLKQAVIDKKQSRYRRVTIEDFEKFLKTHTESYDWKRINGELYPDWQKMGKQASQQISQPSPLPANRCLTRKWSVREDSFLVANYKTLPLDELAIKLHRSMAAIYGRAGVLKKLGTRIPSQRNTHRQKIKLQEAS